MISKTSITIESREISSINNLKIKLEEARQNKQKGRNNQEKGHNDALSSHANDNDKQERAHKTNRYTKQNYKKLLKNVSIAIKSDIKVPTVE